MERLARWGWRRFGVGYFRAYAGLEVLSAFVIAIATLGLLTLYEPVSGAQFLRIALLACGCVLVSLAVGARKVLPRAKPLMRWAKRGRQPRDAPEAWRGAVARPGGLVSRGASPPPRGVASGGPASGRLRDAGGVPAPRLRRPADVALRDLGARPAGLFR